MYRPYLVSRQERAAFRLSGDPKPVTVSGFRPVLSPLSHVHASSTDRDRAIAQTKQEQTEAKLAQLRSSFGRLVAAELERAGL